MLDKAKYVGNYQGFDIVWYGNMLFKGRKDESYRTFCTVPPHAHLAFIFEGIIFFNGYN